MKFLFWNVGKLKANKILADLIQNIKPNFVALAEYRCDHVELLFNLCDRGMDYYPITAIGCERIRIFTDFPEKHIRHKRERDRYTFKELRLIGKKELLVGMVHLQSKLRYSDKDQLVFSENFKVEIEKAESEAGHDRTVIFGDFNMNPFDDGMMSVNGLNSVSCLKTAGKGARKFDGKKSKFFYNPMWNMLGDLDDNPGTYFHRKPSSISHYWNVLDQVILRPSIISSFKKESLEIAKMAGKTSLCDIAGRPKASDHLPFSFVIDLD